MPPPHLYHADVHCPQNAPAVTRQTEGCGLNTLSPGKRRLGVQTQASAGGASKSPTGHWGSGRQEDWKVWPSLGYLLSWRPAWATQDLISKTEIKPNKVGEGKNTLKRAINQSLEDQGVQVGLEQVVASPGDILTLVRLVAWRDGGQGLGLWLEGEAHLLNRKIEAGALCACVCVCVHTRVRTRARTRRQVGHSLGELLGPGAQPCPVFKDWK